MVLNVNYLYRGKPDHIRKKLKLRQKLSEFDPYLPCTTPREAGELTHLWLGGLGGREVLDKTVTNK